MDKYQNMLSVSLTVVASGALIVSVPPPLFAASWVALVTVTVAALSVSTSSDRSFLVYDEALLPDEAAASSADAPSAAAAAAVPVRMTWGTAGSTSATKAVGRIAATATTGISAASEEGSRVTATAGSSATAGNRAAAIVSTVAGRGTVTCTGWCHAACDAVDATSLCMVTLSLPSGAGFIRVVAVDPADSGGGHA